MTLLVRSASFQTAFVAMAYFWGSRGEALGAELGPLGLQPETDALLSELRAAERATRAAALGAELGKLAAALEHRGLLR